MRAGCGDSVRPGLSPIWYEMIIDRSPERECHGLVGKVRALSRIVAIGEIGLFATGCLGSTHVADPFTGHSLSRTAVVGDTVDCDMGPESCSRYIVLRPHTGRPIEAALAVTATTTAATSAQRRLSTPPGNASTSLAESILRFRQSLPLSEPCARP